MFDESLIVQSAISAFNNAALSAPAFLWWAILSVPLLIFVYFCSGFFLEKIGWSIKSLPSKFSLITVSLTFAWLILFGGNYAVLRDNATVLPFVIAAISFVSAFFIGSHTKSFKLSKMRYWTAEKKLEFYVLVLLVLLFIGLSDLHAWWGPILQLGVVILGVLFGRMIRYEMRSIPWTLLIILATTTVILMQPEFFRFGQLGALTAVHLLFLLFTGITVVATIAVRNVNARAKIHKSAYVKIKWLARFLSALGVALFVLTESVPVFLGALFVIFISFALSIWYMDKIPEGLKEKLFAIVLASFGMLTVMPVITAMGVFYWAVLPRCSFWKQIKDLL